MHLPFYLFYTICSGTSQTQSGLFNVIQMLVHISYLQFLTDHHTEAKEIRTFPFYRTVVVQLLLHITLILMPFYRTVVVQLLLHITLILMPFYRTVVVQLLLHITLILMLFQSLTVMFRACGSKEEDMYNEMSLDVLNTNILGY